MRFKPPPPGSPIGWRVEFRVCEAQLTDFENAAFVVFIVLLTRVILTYKFDFLMPISYVSTVTYFLLLFSFEALHFFFAFFSFFCINLVIFRK